MTDNVVVLQPRKAALEYFWLKLEVSLEFLRDDGESDLLRIPMREDYPRLKAALEVDTTSDPARWAMLRLALDVCKTEDVT